MKNEQYSFVELITLLSEGKLKEGQMFESDIFDNTIVVGADGKGLVWSFNPTKSIQVSPNVVESTYTMINPYREITIREMFESLFDGESIYYNVSQYPDSDRPNEYYLIDNLLQLEENSVFNKVTLDNCVRFYKKMF